jgi:hypothetical protein
MPAKKEHGCDSVSESLDKHEPRDIRRWMLHTWPHIHFSDELRFSLRFSDGRYRVYAGLGYVLRTSVCTSPTVLEAVLRAVSSVVII